MMLQTLKILLLMVTLFRCIIYTLQHLHLYYMTELRSLFHLTGIQLRCLGSFSIYYFVQFLGIKNYYISMRDHMDYVEAVCMNEEILRNNTVNCVLDTVAYDKGNILLLC